MAGRKKKAGMDFSPWDVDVFADRKIERLIESKGVVAFAVFFCVCQRIYATNGYYIHWTAEDAPGIKKIVGGEIDTDFIVEVIDVCLDLELFESEVYALYGVLTSKAIQRNFSYVLQRRRRKEVVAEYWILPDEDGAEAILVPRAQME